LIKLCQTEGIAAVHDEGVGVGDIEPRLDDGGAQQHVDLVAAEAAHYARKFVLFHLSVGHTDARFGHQAGEVRLHGVDGLHAVVHKKDLSAAIHLPHDGLTRDARGVRPDVGDDGQSFRRRGVDDGNIPRPGQGHIKRARDGRGREGQHVHLGAQLLEMFLMGHTETLFLIDDHQSQVFEGNVTSQQAVRADDDIHLAQRQLEHDLVLFAGRTEAREHLHAHRKSRKPLAEGLVVLLSQNSRRHQDGHLFAVHDGLKGRTQGDFCLAVAHVAAQEPVHRTRGLHVLLDLIDGLQLVFRLDEGKTCFKIPLPGMIVLEGVSLGREAFGIQFEQVLGDLDHLFAYVLLGLAPIGAAQPGGPRWFTPRTDIAAEPVRLVDGYVELVAALVFHQQELAFRSLQCAADEAAESADAIIHVHHPIAGIEIGVGGFGGNVGDLHPCARHGTHPAEDLTVTDHVQGGTVFQSQVPTLGQAGFTELRRVCRAVRLAFPPDLFQARKLASHHEGLVAFRAADVQILDEFLDLSTESLTG